MYLGTPLLEEIRRDDGAMTARRFTESATEDGRFLTTEDCLLWLADQRAAKAFSVERVPFDKLDGWHFAADTGNLEHRSGRFFTIEGLKVHLEPNRVADWSQPIIVQLEIGILGILVKEFDGVLHCLMQAKMEPGNSNLIQLSPTVQATRSNYTRVHQGSATPYLDFFIAPRRGQVLVDSLQSEQAAWFLHKRNRNIVVETQESVELHPDFCWLTLTQIQDLLKVDDCVNMDARTVLSVMPFAPPATAVEDGDDFRASLLRSMDPLAPAVNTLTDAISWLTEHKAKFELTQRRIPLSDTAGWCRTATEIAHEDGEYFSIVAVDVRAENREVSAWMQPLLLPVAPGLVVFLSRQINGVLHLLLQARPSAGAKDVVEAAPTLHCTPHTFRDMAADITPRFLDYVLDVPADQVRYDTWLSEEGGRFLNARNQYQIIEVDEDFPAEVPTNFMWLTVDQLMSMLRFGNCVNVEARSLLACLNTLW